MEVALGDPSKMNLPERGGAPPNKTDVAFIKGFSGRDARKKGVKQKLYNYSKNNYPAMPI